MALIFFVAQTTYSHPNPNKAKFFFSSMEIITNKKGPPKAARIFLVKRKT